MNDQNNGSCRKILYRDKGQLPGWLGPAQTKFQARIPDRSAISGRRQNYNIKTK